MVYSSSPLRALRTSGARGHDAGDGLLVVLQELHAVHGRDLAHAHGLAQRQVGNVDLHRVGDVARQALHLDLVQHLVQHAAVGVHAHRGAVQAHRDLYMQRLAGVHVKEVHVQRLRLVRVHLHLAQQHVLRALAVDVQRDDGVLHVHGADQQPQRVGVHRQGARLLAVAVQHGGNAAGAAQLARDTLAGIAAQRGTKLGLGHRNTPGSCGAAAVPVIRSGSAPPS
jgi:hypothetical protein